MGSELGPEGGFAECAGQMERPSSNSSVIENGMSVQTTFLYSLTVESIRPSCRVFSTTLPYALCRGCNSLRICHQLRGGHPMRPNYWVSSCNNFG